MLRVVFLGMDLRILDALRLCPAELLGAYLPPGPYRWVRRRPPYLKLIPHFLIKERLRTAAVFAGIADYLSKHQIKPMQARSVNSRSFRNIMLRCKPDLGIVANFGQILSLPLLSIPTHGFINFHPSLLPKYRGPTPLGHILLNAETVAGVTWHKMSPKLDQGAILAQRDFHIRPDDTIRDLDKKAVALAIEMLNPLLALIAQNKLTPIAQDESQASYYAKLTKQEKMRLAQMGKLS